MKKFGPFKTNDVSYTLQAPTGVPGDITRSDESNVEPAMLIAVSSVFVQQYGTAMVYASGGISQWGAGNVAGDFAGVLVRQAPGISGSISSDSSFGGGIPNPLQVQGLMVRGYINVACQYGTPARGGVVYVNIQATGSRILGGFEATSQSSYNVALSATQAEWASDGMDANNNAELRIAR